MSEKWKLVPTELTAENGMKHALIGEFFEVVEEVRDGNPYIMKVPISWTTIKIIHRAMIAASPPPPKAEPVGVVRRYMLETLHHKAEMTDVGLNAKGKSLPDKTPLYTEAAPPPEITLNEAIEFVAIKTIKEIRRLMAEEAEWEKREIRYYYRGLIMGMCDRLLQCGLPPDLETPPPEVTWDEAERIAELPDVHEFLFNLVNDPTGDNGTGLVQAIMKAIGKEATPTGAQLSSYSPDMAVCSVIFEGKEYDFEWSGTVSNVSKKP